jgi:hypothetical protein
MNKYVEYAKANKKDLLVKGAIGTAVVGAIAVAAKWLLSTPKDDDSEFDAALAEATELDSEPQE